VFVTGNAGKLKEVREILAGGPQQPFEVESRELDRQSGGRPLSLINHFSGLLTLKKKFKKNSTRDTGHDPRNS
jgi:hypothetical protein